MRLFRADALRDVAPPPGRYEAETRHLKALIRSGHDVGWVAMPAIYGGEPSSFRALADGLRVMRAIFAPVDAAPGAAQASSRLARRRCARVGAADRASGMLLAWAVAAALPAAGAARRTALPRDQRARRRPGVALPGARPAQPQLPAARGGGHAGGARRHAPAAVRRRRPARDGLRGRLRRPGAGGRPARRRPAPAGGGARRRGAAQPRSPLEPHPVVPVRPPDRHDGARRGGRRDGVRACARRCSSTSPRSP